MKGWPQKKAKNKKYQTNEQTKKQTIKQSNKQKPNRIMRKIEYFTEGYVFFSRKIHIKGSPLFHFLQFKFRQNSSCLKSNGVNVT